MKRQRLIALSLLLLAVLPARAQQKDNAYDNLIAATPDEVIQLRGITRIGYGFHLVRSHDFTAGPSGEFFMNVLTLRMFPHDNLAIDLGLEAEYNFASSKRNFFYLDSDRQVRTAGFDGIDGHASSHSSSLDVFTINLPLLAKFMVGNVCLGIGAEGGFNVTGSTSYRYRVDNRTTRVTESRAKLNVFSYGLTAMADYKGAGLYVKFYPGASSRLLPAGGTDLRYWTLGIVLSME